ncbi:MAG: molybdopterin converting factor subunit 1 [Psychromonas sp.]|nr:molybdopterin converting factor subunit 1 [Psychromonas sp.]
MIKILFFASLKDQLKTESIELPANENQCVDMLLKHLSTRDAIWQKALSNSALCIAVNHTIAVKSTVLKTGDEVAFFPPVTGG